MKTLVRRRVRHLIKKKSEQVDKFAIVTDLSHSMIFRVTEKIIIMVCVGLCCCQISDVFRLYFSYPKSVSFAYEDPKFIKPLELKVCDYSTGFKFFYYSNLTLIEKQLSFKKQKHIPLFRDIEVVGIGGHKISIYNTTTLSNEAQYWQICTSVNLDSVISLKPIISLKGVPNRIFQVILNDISDYPISRYVKPPEKMVLRVQKYHLLSTPKAPCSSDEDFKLCAVHCAAKIIKENATCRAFIFLEDINLPLCRTKKELMKNLNLQHHTLETYIQCGCIKSCNKIIIYPIPRNLVQTNYTDNKLFISSENIFTSLTEYAAYDTINLLTDIGGSMGLCMGWSILSCVYFAYKSLLWIKKRRKNRGRVHYLLDSKIEDVYEKCSCNNNIKMNKWQKWCGRFVVIILCKCLSTYFIQDRVAYYFSYPTRYIVEVQTALTIKLPDITVCGISEYVAIRGKKSLEKFNLTNRCVGDLLDLFDTNLTLHQLWKMSLPFEPRTLPSEHSNVSIVHTHLGDCHRITSSESKYRYVSGGNFVYISYDVSLLKNCTDIYFQAFTHINNDPQSYNIMPPSFIRQGTILKLIVQLQKITDIDTPQAPCTDHKEFVHCKRNCVLKAVIAEKLCSLPYFPLTNNPPCDNSSYAKKSRKRFQEISFDVFNRKECYCAPSCTSDVFHASDELFRGGKNVIALRISVTSNIVDHIKQVRQYSLLKLFCDIGNILCITQSISILTILSVAHRLFTVLTQRINERFNLF